MSRFILHVGPHKTASTYLQAQFTRHRDHLLARGINYPLQWRSTSAPHSHHALVERIQAGDWASIKADCDCIRRLDHGRVVISAEDFAPLPQADLARLNACLGGDAHVVFVLRRWSGLLPSIAAENIRQGSTRTLPETLFDHFAAPLASDAINQARQLDRLTQSFGAGSLRVLIYDEIVRRGMDIFACFLDAVLGLADPPAIAPMVVHASAPIAELELLRLANALRATGQITPAVWQPDDFLQAARAYGLPELAALMQTARTTIDIDDGVNPFAALHRKLAQSYGAATAGPRRDADRLFVPERRSVAYIGSNYLLAPGAACLARRVCAAASAQLCPAIDQTAS